MHSAPESATFGKVGGLFFWSDAMALVRWLYSLLGFPFVSAIETAELQPGDLLVFHLPDGFSPEEVKRMQVELETRLPPNVKCCLVVGDEVRIDIFRADPTSRPVRPIGG
jgi:hypothetical protein